MFIKRTTVSVFLHCRQLIGRFTIEAEDLPLKKLLERYRGFKIYSIYEAGFCGFSLHYDLESLGVKNIVISPNKLPVIKGDRVKTDKKDSLKLALFLSRGLLSSIYIPPKEQIYLRQSMRTREQLIRNKRRAICQLKSLLIQQKIKIKPGYLGLEKIKEISELDLPYLIKSSLGVHIRNLDFLCAEIRKLEQETDQSLKESKYAQNYLLLRSVPGIGPITAAGLTFEIGDWERFKNAKQLSSFLGLTPSEYSSGEHIRKGRITRQGNPWLRTLLVEVSWFLISKDPVMGESFKRIYGQTGSKKKAIVAIARKLVCRLHSLILNKQKYQLGLIS